MSSFLLQKIHSKPVIRMQENAHIMWEKFVYYKYSAISFSISME